MEKILFRQVPSIEAFPFDLVDIATTPAPARCGYSGRYVLYGCLGRRILFEVRRHDIDFRSVANETIRGWGFGVEKSGIGLGLVEEVSGLPRRRVVSEIKNTC